MDKTLVCIANLGSIKSLDIKDIRSFLRRFLSDKRVVDLPQILWYPILYGIILPLRAKKLQKKYQSIWLNDEPYQNVSPLMGYTQNLVKKLNEVNQDPNLHFDYAMSYIEPESGHDIQSIYHKYQGQYERLLVFPLYPHFSTTTTNSLTDQLLKEKRNNPRAYKRIEFIRDYASKDEFLSTITHTIDSQVDFSNPEIHLLFSYHSIPQKRVDEGDSYHKECIESTNLMIKKLQLKSCQYSVSFQSRFGKAKWLEPATDKTLIKLAQKGVKHLVVICPGFSMDCLETLEEINMEGRRIFLEHAPKGSQFTYIPCLNDSDEKIQMIQKITKNKLTVHKK